MASLEAVWSRHADDLNTVSPEDIYSILREINYGQKMQTFGRGTQRQTVALGATHTDAVFCLRELGVGDLDKKAHTRIPYAAFKEWLEKKTEGEHGARKNRLLIKPALGSVKASSYSLPSQEFTYGKSSGKDPVTVTELLAHKFERGLRPQPTSAADSSVPSRLDLRTSSKFEGKTFGRTSPRHADIGELLSPGARHGAAGGGAAGLGSTTGSEGKAAKPVKIAERERTYPDLSGMHTLGRLPEPRPTLTSTLRHKQAHGEALRAGDTTGFGGGSNSQRRGSSGAAELSDTWKMRQFRDVAPRVPLNGKPLRQNTGH